MGWGKSKDYRDMTEQEKVDAFLASQQLMDDEVWIYKQQALPTEARFGGEFGLPSYLGYLGGKGRGEAKVKHTGIDTPYTFGSLGSYYRHDPQNTAEREKTILGRIKPKDQNLFKKYYQGVPESDTVYVDYPADDPTFDESSYPREVMKTLRELAGVRQRVGDARLMDVAGVTSHELDHRFYHSPFYKDMFEHYSDPKNLPFDQMTEAGILPDIDRRLTEKRFELKKDPSIKTLSGRDLNPLIYMGLPQDVFEQHIYAIDPIDRRFRPSLRAANQLEYLKAATKLNTSRGALAARPDDREWRKQNLRDDIKEQQESFQKNTFADDDLAIEYGRRRDFLIRNYLTPERQEEYGLRLPLRESRAMSYEELLKKSEEKDETGIMDKIYGLIGRLTN